MRGNYCSQRTRKSTNFIWSSLYKSIGKGRDQEVFQLRRHRCHPQRPEDKPAQTRLAHGPQGKVHVNHYDMMMMMIKRDETKSKFSEEKKSEKSERKCQVGKRGRRTENLGKKIKMIILVDFCGKFP